MATSVSFAAQAPSKHCELSLPQRQAPESNNVRAKQKREAGILPPPTESESS